MVQIRYEFLEIDHIVEVRRDRTIFAAAREGGNSHMRLFLINETTGCVYTRNGRIDSWEELMGSERDAIVARIIAARNNHTPVYTINGSQNN
jgi:hypothetical protein